MCDAIAPCTAFIYKDAMEGRCVSQTRRRKHDSRICVFKRRGWRVDSADGNKRASALDQQISAARGANAAERAHENAEPSKDEQGVGARIR